MPRKPRVKATVGTASSPTKSPADRLSSRPSTRACDKRPRPAWWTPENVLALLQAGEYVGTICQQAADELATQLDGQHSSAIVSWHTLRRDISVWAESLTWGEQFERALSLVVKDHSTHELVYSKVWHDEFFFAMEASNGNMAKACEATGIGMGVVLAITDRRNRKAFDEEFAERLRIAEAQRVGTIREQYMQMAEDGIEKGAAKGIDARVVTRAQERIVETHLPHMHGTRQEVIVEGTVDHKHTHSHVHSIDPKTLAAVAAASEARVRGLRASPIIEMSLPVSSGDQLQSVDIVVPEEQPWEYPNNKRGGV